MTFLSKILAGSPQPYYSACTGWPEEYLDALQMIRDKGKDIDRGEFLANVKWTLNSAPNDFIPKDDHHVRYKKYERIYFFVHSGIEYVFCTEKQIQDLKDLIDREHNDPDDDIFSYDFNVKSEKETGDRMFVLNRRKLLQKTDSRPVLKKAIAEDSDPECVRIAQQRIKTK